MPRFHHTADPAPLVQGLLWGFICAILVWGAHSAGYLDESEDHVYDALLRTRGLKYPSSPTRILVVDDMTVARYGRWPLPRHVYAGIVQRLTRAGARTIAFDIQFSVPSGQVSEDESFARACRESGRVVQAMVFHVPRLHSTSINPQSNVLVSPQPRFGIPEKKVEAPCLSAVWGTATQIELQQSAVALGHLNVYPESDGVLRRIPHLIRYRGIAYPSLALATAAHFLDIKPDQIRTDNHEVSLLAADFTRRIPLDEHGETLINWAGANRRFPTYTFNEVLDERVPDAVFRGAVVLVGVTATGAFEHHPTPFSPNQPVVELQASALDDIVSNRPLRESGVAPQVCLLLAFSMIAGALVMWIVVKRGAWAGLIQVFVLCGMLWLGALFLLSQHNYYLPIGAPLFSCLLTGALAISARQINDARALRTAEERYALAVRGANDGLWDWSLQTNEIYYSPRWKAMLGYREDEIGAAPEEWFSRVHSSDRVGLQAAIALHLNGQVPHFQCEHRLLHRDGVYRWVLARGLKVASQGPASSRPSRMAGSLTEITERKRSEENLSRSHEQLRALAARVESAQEEERMRIAREIHDELGQALTGLKFDVRWLRRALEHSDHASVHVSDPASENLLREKVDGMSGQLDEVIESVQAIATQLRPSVLDHLGLEAAIEWRAQDFEDRTGITCEFASGSPGLNVEGECATGLFRICQEALTNVARHAMASRVWISLQEQNNELVLEIRDNGRGIRGDEEANRSSLGLLGMRERALALGGSVEVTGIPGHGTTVRVRVPMSDHIDERNVISGNVQRSDCEQDPHSGG